MWSDHLNVIQQAPWGTCINELDTEASLVEQNASFIALLECMAVIRVSGEEAASFLQGQITCDVSPLNSGQAVLGAHCNAKGRAQSTFLCLRQGDDFLLLLPQDQVAPTIQVLSKFAMFSKADVTADESLLVFAPAGPDQATIHSMVQDANQGATLFTLPALGSLGVIAQAQAPAFIQLLQQHSIPLVGDNAWNLSQINGGLVHIHANQAENWIPQEINYDLVEGVNFKKGCYKGQEIVARIHYRGQTKVRTFPLEIHGCDAVEIGDKIVSEAGNGTILAVARVSECTLKVLSTLKIEASESQNLKLEQNDACQIHVLPLPYAIT